MPGLQINLVWTPAESGITDIASYTIYRGVDGATPTSFLVCNVLRDFLGGIVGVQNCTLAEYPEHPGDPEVNVPPDQNITYVDEDVSLGHDYCYMIVATPMGNNQSVAQGPPVNSDVACSVTALLAPVLNSWYDMTDAAAGLQWGLPDGFFILLTGWTISRAINGGSYSVLTTVGANELSFLDETVESGNDYSYTITYTAFSMTSAASAPTTVIVP